MDTYGQPMYCRQCSYLLVSLPANRCPECGSEFDPSDPETFEDRPPPPMAERASRFLHGVASAASTTFLVAFIVATLLSIEHDDLRGESWDFGSVALVAVCGFVLTWTIGAVAAAIHRYYSRGRIKLVGRSFLYSGFLLLLLLMLLTFLFA